MNDEEYIERLRDIFEDCRRRMHPKVKPDVVEALEQMNETLVEDIRFGGNKRDWLFWKWRQYRNQALWEEWDEQENPDMEEWIQQESDEMDTIDCTTLRYHRKKFTYKVD